MNNLFSFLFLVSFICLIIGLIKPTVFSRFIKGEVTKKKICLIFGIAMIVLLALVGATPETEKTKQLVNNPAPVATTDHTVATQAGTQ